MLHPKNTKRINNKNIKMLSFLRLSGPNTIRRRRNTPRNISHRIRSPRTKTRWRLRRLQITKRHLTPRMQRGKHHLPRRGSSDRRTCSRRRVSARGRSFFRNHPGSNRHGKRQRAPARAHDVFLQDLSTWSRLAVWNLMAKEVPPTTTVRILRLRQVFHRRWTSQRRRSTRS